MRCAVAATLLSLAIWPQVQVRPIRVAAASDLRFAMQDLATQFERQTGEKVEVVYGSSGNLFSQIQSGAPFDLFFSADTEYPKDLATSGLAEPNTFCTYALGVLVLWTPADSTVDVARDSWKILLDSKVQKVAIANPQHAPYGRAAVAALTKAGIYEQVSSKLVYGENISQAAQFAQSGNAQAGILAKSLLLSSEMRSGKSWEIPSNLYPRIEQAVVVLKSAADKNAARSFLAFVKEPAGRAILYRNGFALPDAPRKGAAIP